MPIRGCWIQLCGLPEEVLLAHANASGRNARHVGFSAAMLKRVIEKLDIPPVDDFIAMIHHADCESCVCRATADMFHLKREDFCNEVDGIISVGSSTKWLRTDRSSSVELPSPNPA